ncbi:MAG: ATP-binding protein [Candidatus Eisenbacteria bacterium]
MLASVPELPACLARLLWHALRQGPPVVTLDLLRSDLAHELRSKIPCLSLLLAEWQRGRYHAEDPADALEILDEIERNLLRYAALLASRPSTLLHASRMLARIRAARGRIRPALTGRTLSLVTLEKLRTSLDRLLADGLHLAERASHPCAVRIEDLASEITDELRREAGGGLAPRTIAVHFEDRRPGVSTWVPRAEVQHWRDLLRNIIRNAVQATCEREAAGTVPTTRRPRPVIVRLAPLAAGLGTRVEVVDEGVGMTSAEIGRMWVSGSGTHGRGRGHGLTEAKHRFALDRGNIAVSSAPGRGTTFTLELQPRDIPISPPSRLLPCTLAAAVVLLPAFAVVAILAPRTAEIVTAEIVNPTTIRTLGERGQVIWERDLGEAIIENSGGSLIFVDGELVRERLSPLVLRNARGRARGILLATQPDAGDCRLRLIRPGAQDRWVRTMRFKPPASEPTSRSFSQSQMQCRWGDGRDVAAVTVRDRWYAATTVQFISFEGESLGAYYHPGHLNPICSGDIDMDGREEVLLSGINNFAKHDSTIVPSACEDYVDCMVMLEPPAVNGQAWPWHGWNDMDAAREEAYLLIPPLGPRERGEIFHVDVSAAPRPPGAPAIEVRLADGRIYRTDEHLRPFSCLIGDFTAAESLIVRYEHFPLVYFFNGRRETIEVPIGDRTP